MIKTIAVYRIDDCMPIVYTEILIGGRGTKAGVKCNVYTYTCKTITGAHNIIVA